MEDKTRTAYHEAGHAVMHYIRDVPINCASIEETEDTLGKVQWDMGSSSFLQLNLGGRSNEVRSLAKSQALIVLAGIAAETLAFGQYWQEGAESDLDSFHHYAYYVSRDTERYATQIKSEAKSLLRKNWRMVRAVADALLEKHTLTHKELYSIIESVG